MRKFFSFSFWKYALASKLLWLAWWLYADPGLVNSYFPYIFMYQVFKGTSEDSATTLTFSKSTSGPPLSRAVTVYTFNFPMYIQLSYDGSNFSNTIEIPIGKFYHFSQTARAARIYNKNSGQNARFQFIAWYVISKY